MFLLPYFCSFLFYGPEDGNKHGHTAPPSSEKHLLSWDRDKLRKSVSIGSLTFMEAGRRCLGGAGLLWMCCPVSVASKFRECLSKQQQK